MDSTITLIVGGGIAVVAANYFAQLYGHRYRAGGGQLKADDSWQLLSEYLPRPFFFNVDSQILYRAIARQIITEKPVSKMRVRMVPILTEPTANVEVIEPLFRSDFNPPRAGSKMSIFSNDQAMWYFSEMGVVTDEKMPTKIIEDLNRKLALKDEELIQERAERDAKLKDTFNMVSKLQRAPAPSIRVDDGR